MITRLAAACFVVAAAAVPSEPTARVDEFVKTEMARQHIPGMAIGIVRGGKVLEASGFGLANVELNVPVGVDTLFQSGSLGKQFTAVALMTLVEDGKVSLSDSILKYFPDGPDAWRAVTVRNLLTHTSGIPNYTDGMIDLRKDYTEDDFERLTKGLTLEFPPGSSWKYSNTGYVLLGIIIHRASGKFYGDLLRERVFGPLGMKTARVMSEQDIVPNRAAGYSLVRGELNNQSWVSPSLNTTADGALYLSLNDYFAWDRGIREKAILKPESWEQIFTPVTLTSGKPYPYGFGWRIDTVAGQKVERHGGSWQGFRAAIARYPGDDMTIIALANLAQANPEKTIEGIAAILDPKLHEQPSGNQH
jgi:CubicO group peptidase (beta-lactamase class C family)